MEITEQIRIRANINTRLAQLTETEARQVLASVLETLLVRQKAATVVEEMVDFIEMALPEIFIKGAV